MSILNCARVGRFSSDRSIREFCTANEIHYQGFSILTANRDTLIHPELVQIASKYRRSVSQIVFRFAVEVGMFPLTGTTDPEHGELGQLTHTTQGPVEWIQIADQVRQSSEVLHVIQCAGQQIARQSEMCQSSQRV